MSTFLIEWGQEGLLHPTRAAGLLFCPALYRVISVSS
jgi:hypothetical protein